MNYQTPHPAQKSLKQSFVSETLANRQDNLRIIASFQVRKHICEQAGELNWLLSKICEYQTNKFN